MKVTAGTHSRPHVHECTGVLTRSIGSRIDRLEPDGHYGFDAQLNINGVLKRARVLFVYVEK